MIEHVMIYRAGRSGFSAVGLSDVQPHWYCSCELWKFNAKPMPNRVAGNNSIEAERSFNRHVKGLPT